IASGLATTPLETLTMRPQPAASMPGRTAAVSAAGATTLTSKARRSPAAGMEAVAPSGSTMAALLIRMSTRPASAASAVARRWSSSPRSAATMRTWPGRAPRATARSWVWLSWLAERATRMRLAPASASPTATARPMPRPAPVMSAVRPAKSAVTAISFVKDGGYPHRGWPGPAGQDWRSAGHSAVTSVSDMTSIDSLTLEVADPAAAERFYAEAFGLGTEVRVRTSEEPTTGFRGFTLSLTVSQPANASALIDAAVEAGATTLKPAAKSMWGFGGVVQAPDGTIWKVATSAKKDSGPPTRQIDEIVLLLGVEDVLASKRFYVDRGLVVARSFGRKYVQFATEHVK